MKERQRGRRGRGGGLVWPEKFESNIIIQGKWVQVAIIILRGLSARMSLFPSDNACFRNLEEISWVSSEHIGLPTAQPDYKPSRHTEAQDLVLPAEALPRMPPKVPLQQEISFEKHFLSEHTAAFRLEFQNFLEFAITQALPSPPPDLETLRSACFASSVEQPLSEFMRNPPSSVASDAWRGLHDMVRRKDLESFLSHVSESCRKGVVLELLCVAAGVWKELGSLNFRICEGKYLLRVAERWAVNHRSHYFNRAGFSHINLRTHLTTSSDALQSHSSTEAVFQQTPTFNPAPFVDAFGRFLNCFAATLLFVAAGYFQNPFAECQGEEDSVADFPKRQLSCASFSFLSDICDFSDSEDSAFPSKKRKP